MIMIFAGAGASKAVSSDGYPTTVEFFDGLPRAIADHPIQQLVLEYIRNTSRPEVVDIEQVLWALSEIIGVTSGLTNPATAMGFALREHRLDRALGLPKIDFQTPVGHIESLLKQATQLRELINAEVYRHYAPSPPQDGLDNTWIPLLQGISELPDHLEIVTTNYDTIIEHAVTSLDLPVSTGRRRSVYSQLDLSLWVDGSGGPTRRKGGLLTKLHGSVDWTRSGGTIYFGTPTFLGRHEDRAIIYPGFKSVPTEEPFIVFHRHFADSLTNTTKAVFVGYAFRDEYINSLLAERLPSTASVVVLNPVRPANMPFASERVQHVPEYFERKSIPLVMAALASAPS